MGFGRFFNSGAWQAIPDVLRKEGWVEVPGVCKFGYPWPWSPVDDGPGLIDGSGADRSVQMIAALVAPHTKFLPTAMFWPQAGAFDATGAVVRDLPALYGGVLSESRQVLVGGRSAFVVDLDLHGGERVSRLVADAPHGTQLHGELRVPRASAAGYRWHWWAMLGSWQWR
ncbi:hypothetical protein ACWEIJ_23295 [Lentzea sp. NPDC004789]